MAVKLNSQHDWQNRHFTNKTATKFHYAVVHVFKYIETESRENKLIKLKFKPFVRVC